MMAASALMAMCCPLAWAAVANHDDHDHEHTADTASVRTEVIEEVSVTGGVKTRRMAGAVNGQRIGQQEIFRAACCNLGESFTTNPSVDVSYSDAATGAKQIKLLGLSGTYVQLLTENMPAFRGAAQPFALSYVPGTWMKGINVSKGAASVKNGYESLTGQIDIDYLKPEDEKKTNADFYINDEMMMEANVMQNFHLSEHLSSNILVHWNGNQKEMDMNNDHWMDMPLNQQVALTSRWKLDAHRYIMHAGVETIVEHRKSGQTKDYATPERYQIGIDNNNYSAFMKHAYFVDPDRMGNVALIVNASKHETDATYGKREARSYEVDQTNIYAQLMYETELTEQHKLSAGVSWTMDDLKQDFRLNQTYDKQKNREKENVTGGYVQYTYDLGTKLTAMAGVRVDHSSEYGTFWTPRMHVKYQPVKWLTLRTSAGKGYRTVHALAENHNLMASGRVLCVGWDADKYRTAQPDVERLKQEEAWNMGVSAALLIPVGEKMLKVNGEYYYTDFEEMAVTDYDLKSDRIVIHNLNGEEAFSHVWQVDAEMEVLRGFTVLAAYRRNNVKSTFAHELKNIPLTSRYKAMLSLGYKTPLELWQFDVTMQLNGGGSLPAGRGKYGSYEQLTAQVTRQFRYFDLFVGGENLTNFYRDDMILNVEDPWSTGFDPTMIYAPMKGAMVYGGIRFKL